MLREYLRLFLTVQVATVFCNVLYFPGKDEAQKRKSELPSKMQKKPNLSEVDLQRPAESQLYFQGSQFNLSSSAHTLTH